MRQALGQALEIESKLVITTVFPDGFVPPPKASSEDLCYPTGYRRKNLEISRALVNFSESCIATRGRKVTGC